MRLVDQHQEPVVARLAAGPALFVAAVVLGFASNASGGVAGLDRAAFGWIVVVPLLLAGPVVTGLTARWAGVSAVRLVIAAASVAVGIGLLAILVGTATQLGCTPITDPMRRVGPLLPTAIAAGAAYGLPASVALAFRSRLWVAVVAGGAASLLSWLGVLVVMGWTLMGGGCAHVPG
jgi:hypothetical protein